MFYNKKFTKFEELNVENFEAALEMSQGSEDG